MPIQANSEIDRNEIADALRVRNCVEQQYINNTPDYKTPNEIRNLFTNAVYINPNSLDVSLYAKTINIPSRDVIKQNTDIGAQFDYLVSMFANAFIPASNIRYCEFTFMEKINNRYSYNKHYKVVSLADKAINGTNTEDYANNIREYSKDIGVLNTEELFLQNAGNLQARLNELRSNLVKDYYYDKNNVPLISTGTVETLSGLFVEGLQHILSALSCQFKDESMDPKNERTITFHEYADGKTPSGADDDTETINSYRYFYIQMPAYYWDNDYTAAFRGWSRQKNAGTPEYTAGSEYLVLDNQHFYPVLAKSVIYQALSDDALHGAFQTATNIESVSRNSYVVARNRDSNTQITERVIYGTRNFLLPPPDKYFTYNQNIINNNVSPTGVAKTVTYLGWHEIQPNDILFSGNQTNLTIDKDFIFKPRISLTFGEPPPVYESKTVDLRITNLVRACQPNQEAPFDIIIPINGACRNGSGTNERYSLQTPITSLGLKIKNSINPNFIKSLSIQMRITGNTQHAGKYRFKIVQFVNGRSKTVYGPTDEIWFKAGETANNQDNFGIAGNMWDFLDANTATYNYTFTFDVGNTDLTYKQASQPVSTYIEFWGKTGYSTDNKNGYYPYRCRAEITVTNVSLGYIYQ